LATSSLLIFNILKENLVLYFKLNFDKNCVFPHIFYPLQRMQKSL